MTCDTLQIAKANGLLKDATTSKSNSKGIMIVQYQARPFSLVDLLLNCSGKDVGNAIS
jgi:hypothetical protein